jgi:single-stranded DNA-binding protein
MIRVVLVGRLLDRFVERETKNGVKTAVARVKCDSKYGTEYMTLRVYGQWLIQEVVGGFGAGDVVVVSGRLRGYGIADDPKAGRKYEVVCDVVDKLDHPAGSEPNGDLFAERQPARESRSAPGERRKENDDEEFDPFA